MKILIVSFHVQHSPQAVALAAGNLKAALPESLQQQTQLLDFTLQQSGHEILEAIKSEEAELIAFSVYLWNREITLQLAQELKKQKTPPFILLGGPEASADSTKLLASGNIDAVLRGEGEESFARLVEQLSRGEESQEIPGVHSDPNQPAPEACSCDIDLLESPWLSSLLHPVTGGVLWEVARGCPFDCSFCYDAKGMAGVRPLPMARLAKELEHFTRTGAEQVWVLDSTFNAPAKRGQQLLRLLAEKAPQIHYHLEAKAEFIDAKTIDLLGRISCSVQLGLQTTNNEVLAGLNRKISPAKFWAGVELLATSGLTFGLDLIYGLPGDDYAGFLTSLEKTLSYRPNQIDIFPLAVLPGTVLFGKKDQLQMTADDSPPYLLQESSDFSAEQMHACELIKATVDLFYNRGRAVGFLNPICLALETSPRALLEDFKDWFINNSGKEALLNSESLQTFQILQLQQKFLQEQLETHNQTHLHFMVHDILEYHFHYAETLIDKEVLPQGNVLAEETPLRLAEGVHLVSFHSDILGALETEEIDLKRWIQLVEQVPTAALMIRRGRQIISELLTDDFTVLLQLAQKELTARQILAKLPAGLGEELLEFAWEEGLLISNGPT